MDVAAVARTVRIACEGVKATYLQSTKEKIDFRVKIDDRYQKNKMFLENLLIPNNTGRLIKLKEVALIKTGTGRSTINHYNGDRVITITADVDKDITTSAMVAQSIKQKFAHISEKYPGADLIFGGEAKETKDSMGDLKSAFLTALLSIYIILILLFRSFSQPLLVLAIIPFGLVGSLLALTLHGILLSFMGMIGIIGLSGVVVNDSIIMVDFINKVFSGGADNGIRTFICNFIDIDLNTLILSDEYGYK